MTKTPFPRAAVVAAYAGLGLTLLATLAPFVDRATKDRLAGHIRAGYPSYTTAEVETAATTYVILLTVLGALGVAAWLVTTRAVTTGKRWAPFAATTLLVVGVSVGLLELLTTDTSGDTGLPPIYGAVALVPYLAGLVVVVTLWRGRHGGGLPA